MKRKVPKENPTLAMKLARFLKNNINSYGVYEDGFIFPVDSLFNARKGTEKFPASEARPLAPCLPTKIICGGLNYKDHAAEMGMSIPVDPLIFMKPSSAVLDPGGVIKFPPLSKQLEYEGELAVVIGKKAKDVSEADAHAYILGYTCINDVTARDLQKKDGQWTRAKSFDTFAPLGPWIETELDPCCQDIETCVNGERRQSSNTSNMIFSVFYLVSFISRVMTLNPGDVIATGTPPGVGQMHVGDEVEVRISGIGSLKNKIG